MYITLGLSTDAELSLVNSAAHWDQLTESCLWSLLPPGSPTCRSCSNTTNRHYGCSCIFHIGCFYRSFIASGGRKVTGPLATHKWEFPPPNCQFCNHTELACFEQVPERGSPACHRRSSCFDWLSGCSSRNHRAWCTMIGYPLPGCFPVLCLGVLCFFVNRNRGLKQPAK